MTSNQRRPGFRLPWAAEGEDSAQAQGPDAQAAAPESAENAMSAPAPEAATAPGTAASTPATEAGAASTAATPEPAAAAAPPDSTATAGAPAGDPPAVPAATETRAEAVATAPATPGGTETAPVEGDNDFLKELVAAMRRVADEARQTGVADLHARTDEHVRQLEVESERRREELRTRADADIAGVGEWAKAEAERIRAEAEQRVAARRTQLEQQLAAEAGRAESEAKALRDRVAEFERELEAYHAQLAEISDPAAFAAAAKRIPRPPGAPRPAPVPTDAPAAANGTTPPNVDALHAAGEEVLAARLAELDATLGEGDAPAAQAAPATATTVAVGEPVTTEVVVKGLGSFGAITGFRQSLSAVDGIDGVTLSLGPTGEFVFRASHAPGFDLGGAITTLEGDGAKVEPRPEGGLKVTLERSR